MKKILFILISFLFIQNVSYATSKIDESVDYYSDEEPKKLTAKKVINDVNEINSEMDTALSTGKEIVDIVVVSVKENGVKKTIQIYSSLFVPLFVCGVLFLLYLRKRKNN